MPEDRQLRLRLWRRMKILSRPPVVLAVLKATLTYCGTPGVNQSSCSPLVLFLYATALLTCVIMKPNPREKKKKKAAKSGKSGVVHPSVMQGTQVIHKATRRRVTRDKPSLNLLYKPQVTRFIIVATGSILPTLGLPSG